MSYILDALKKSEQERGHGNVPGVQTVHTSSLNYKDKKAYWPYILITVVALNLVVMLYFLLGKETGTAEESINNQVATEETSAEKIKTNTPPKKSEIPVPTAAPIIIDDEQSRPPVIETREKTAIVDTAVDMEERPLEQDLPVEYRAAPTEQNDIISYHELDESIKQQLPAIIVSAHVYSSNPQQRSIVINNDFLEEGEYIIDGLILHEITPSGAILNYNGILFRSDVVSGWQ